MLQDVRDAAPLARLKPGVRDRRETEGRAIEVRRLVGVPHVEFDVVVAFHLRKALPVGGLRQVLLSNHLRPPLTLRRGTDPLATRGRFRGAWIRELECVCEAVVAGGADRKSTRLKSTHVSGS